MTTYYGNDTHRVADDIIAERRAQDEKWGEQNHLDSTSSDAYATRRDSARVYCDSAAVEGRCTWRHILTEEFYEALSETEPAALRTELVQVAAVAQAWIEAIDRRALLEREKSCQGGI